MNPLNCRVDILPVLNDNYIFLLIDLNTSKAVAVDPGTSAEVLNYLQVNNIKLDEIWLTHHHLDHVGGTDEIRRATSCRVRGFAAEEDRLPRLDIKVCDSDIFRWQGLEVKVRFTPGHTSGHIVYFLPEPQFLFCGDVLFSLGCGRLFEGSAEQMFANIQTFKHDPPGTQVFCAHEYTLKNLDFAKSLTEFDFATQAWQRALAAYQLECMDLRRKSDPTIPTTLAREKKLSPFFLAKDIGEFARLRELRNQF